MLPPNGVWVIHDAEISAQCCRLTVKLCINDETGLMVAESECNLFDGVARVFKKQSSF